MACQSCGRAVFDTTGTHVLCCAPGVSTRGHNDVRNELLDFVRLADSTAQPEILGLIASAPGLRPADILTSALAGRSDIALDVGIASSTARLIGEDCTETYRRRKINRYAPFSAELATEGIIYRPVIWSCYGREHEETSIVLEQLARRAARRFGHADHKWFLAKSRVDVGVALARRSAQMVHACMRRRTYCNGSATRLSNIF